MYFIYIQQFTHVSFKRYPSPPVTPCDPAAPICLFANCLSLMSLMLTARKRLNDETIARPSAVCNLFSFLQPSPGYDESIAIVSP